MHAWELIRQFLFDLRTRKLRLFLAVSGIAWGTLSVILLLAIGSAFHRASRKAMHGMGDDIVVMWTARTTKAFAGMKPGRAIQMRAGDVVRMGRSVPEIAMVSPELTLGNRTLEVDGHRVKASVAGVVPEYEIMRNMLPVPGGRFIDPLDVTSRRRVIFLGDEVKEKLYGEVPAEGRTVFVDGRPFTVIGTLVKKLQTSSYSGVDADRTFIPYSTFIAVWGNRNVANTLLVPVLEGDAGPMKRAVYEYLGEKYRFDPTDRAALSMWDTVRMDGFVNWFFWGLQALMGLGGLLTLGAGGIGVANTMFLIVRERTREIGVRMAVGAHDRHIMGQVLLEAVCIVALGGLGGFIAAVGVIALLSLVPLPEWIARPELEPTVAAGTIAILTVVGLAAGLFPARRAARLDPVQALEFSS